MKFKTTKDITKKDIETRFKELLQKPEAQQSALIIGICALLIHKKIITPKELEQAKKVGEKQIINNWRKSDLGDLKAEMALESLFHLGENK